MRYLPFRYLHLLLALVAFAGAARAQRGNPLLRNFSLADYPGGGRVQAIVEDRRGFLYLGTADGVVRYDGRRWEPVANADFEVTALAVGPDSLIYVGGRTEFGRLQVNPADYGRLSFQNLTPDSVTRANFADVLSLVTLDARTMVVVTKRSLVRYTIGKPKADAPQQVEGSYDITGSFQHEGALFVNFDLPSDSATLSLYKYLRSFTTFTYPSDTVRLYPRFGVTWRKGQTLVGTTDGRLLVFDGRNFIPAPTDVSEYLSRAGLTSATRVGERYIALGTASGGCLVLDANTLKIETVLNLQAGLPDNEISAVGHDLDGGLWVAHGQGLARLDMLAPIRDLSVYGALASINDIAQIGNTLFVATNSGVYRLGANYSQGMDSDEALRGQISKRLSQDRETALQEEINRKKQERMSTGELSRKKYETALKTDINILRIEKERLAASKNPKLNKKERAAEVARLTEERSIKARALNKWAADAADAENRAYERQVEQETRSVYEGLVKSETDLALKDYLTNKKGKPLPRIDYLNGFAFTRVRGLESKCTELVVAQGQLLAATSSGLFTIGDDARPLWQPEAVSLAQLYVLPSHPTCLYVATNKGIRRFAYQGSWVNKGELPGVEGSIASVVEIDKATVAASTAEGPLLRIERPETELPVVSSDVTVPGGKGPLLLRSVLGKARVFTRKGAYLTDYTERGFVRDPILALPNVLGTPGVVAEINASSIWLSRGGEFYRLSQRTPDRISVDTIGWAHSLKDPITRMESDGREKGSVWVMSGGKLLRLSADAMPPVLSYRFTAFVDALLAESDSTYEPEVRALWEDKGDPWWLFWKQLPGQLSNRELTMLVSAPSFSDPRGTKFRYRLLGPGLGREWRAWIDDDRAQISGLQAGDYTIEVQARDGFGRLSRVTKARVLTPRKLWEYQEAQWSVAFLGLLTVGGSTWRFIRWRTSALEKRNQELEQRARELNAEREALLHNILPPDIARELETHKEVTAVNHKNVTVLFTDFKGFTIAASQMKPKELVEELNACFSKFDSIMEEFGLEKIKTIGDAYMAASGIPKASATHAVDAVLAGLAIQHFMNDYMRARASKGKVGWELRLGIHSGPLVAGVIGKKKFAYDIWGDTVNTAARMESSGEVNRVNISAATYALVKDYFSCTHRGEVEAKNKGKLDMYFVDGLKGKFINLEAGDHQTHVPNSLFWQTVGKPIPSVAKA